MRNKKLLASTFYFLISTLLIVSCNFEFSPSDRDYFANDLHGTWVSNDASVYSGRLVISYDQITITGYNEGQTPAHVNDAQRPFREFTKGVALLGYSEPQDSFDLTEESRVEGYIFIRDAGLWQSAIPFTYWEEGPSSWDFSGIPFLRFNFGGRLETLRKE